MKIPDDTFNLINKHTFSACSNIYDQYIPGFFSKEFWVCSLLHLDVTAKFLKFVIFIQTISR